MRTLRKNEIDVKVKQVTEKGCVALLYKTARVDMDILDEEFTPLGWECEYREIKGNLYCGIGVKAEDGKTVWKWDCGIESREDEEGNQKKGEASDSFKRAGFKWGIGRELYTSPFIWIPAEKITIVQGRNGKPTTRDKFEVEKIAYDEQRRISGLSIVNQRRERVFIWTAR